MKNEYNNILGCFVSSTVDAQLNEAERNFEFNQGKIFRDYLWRVNGIGNKLKKLNKDDYGNDLAMILFQFYINPIQNVLNNLKEIETYRKKEKSIGIPIIINNDNFFSQSETERYRFLTNIIFKKLELLTEVVYHKKLDTKIDLLKLDLKSVLDEI